MDPSSSSSHLNSDEESQPSSFLSQLQTKLNKGLRPTSTNFTNTDGTVTVLKSQGSIVEDSSSGGVVKRYGFVVDTKPDLSIGKVRPWLCISSQDVPNDLILIKNNKITHILSLLPGFQLNPLVKNILRGHLVLDVYDEEGFNLKSPDIIKALEFIHHCRESDGVVLVHCNAGLSRAPTTAMLYLMKYEGLSFEDTWKLVKEARPSMIPNQGFVRQLKALNVSSS